MGTVRVERCPDCQSLVGEGGLYQHQERYCEKRKPKVYAADFLSHVVVARSQYQPIVRDMAAEILSLRSALAEAKGEIEIARKHKAHSAGLAAAPPIPDVAETEAASESIDGVSYRIEVINSEAFIEPGHDRILQSTTFAESVLYFTQRSVYRVPLAASLEPTEVSSPAAAQSISPSNSSTSDALAALREQTDQEKAFTRSDQPQPGSCDADPRGDQ